MEDEALEYEMWVSYYLQDGTQLGASFATVDINEAEDQLREQHGGMYGGIADYGYYEEVEK